MTLADSTISGDIVGGKGGSTGTTGQNSVSLTNTTVSGSVYGGWNSDNKEHSVTNNTITATDSTLKGSYLYGGYSQSSQAGTKVSGNRIELTNTSYKYVNGGKLSGAGEVSDNHVVITASPEGSGYNVYGGDSQGGTVTNNSVTIEGGATVAGLYGGRSSSSSAVATLEGNTVVIKDSTFSTASKVASYSPTKIYGASIEATNSTGDTSNALNNAVTIEGSTVYAIVYGAYTKGLSKVSGNSVTVTDCTVSCGSGGIYGAYNEHSADITGNSVTVADSTVTGTIVGGLNKSGATATNNTVTIDGSTVVGNIYGGYCESVSQGTSTGNTVILKSTNQAGDLSQAAVYGGYTRAKDAVSDNTLSMEGYEGAIKSVTNFDTIEQTGGEVTINSGKLNAATSVSLKGTDSDTPATLISGASDGALSVSGSESVTMENAELYAEGTVTIQASESIALKNTAIVGTGLTLSGEGDASTRTLENVKITLASGSVADLRNSTLRGSTAITVTSLYTMMGDSDEAVTVLLDGSIVELNADNTTVSANSDGKYTIATTALAGVDVQGNFTMDFSALSDQLDEDFTAIEVQYTDTQLDPASSVIFALNGQTYETTQNADGSGYTVGNVPEPSTATLSLLALAALAARRRRK